MNMDQSELETRKNTVINDIKHNLDTYDNTSKKNIEYLWKNNL